MRSPRLQELLRDVGTREHARGTRPSCSCRRRPAAEGGRTCPSSSSSLSRGPRDKLHLEEASMIDAKLYTRIRRLFFTEHWKGACESVMAAFVRAVPRSVWTVYPAAITTTRGPQWHRCRPSRSGSGASVASSNSNSYGEATSRCSSRCPSGERTVRDPDPLRPLGRPSCGGNQPASGFNEFVERCDAAIADPRQIVGCEAEEASALSSRPPSPSPARRSPPPARGPARSPRRRPARAGSSSRARS